MELHQLRIIKTQDDCSEFLQWLGENQEVTQVQGWHVVRTETGRAYEFSDTPDGCFASTKHYLDVKFMWEYRRSLNDWIRTFKSQFIDWSQYGQFATEAKAQYQEQKARPTA